MELALIIVGTLMSTVGTLLLQGKRDTENNQKIIKGIVDKLKG